MRARLSPELVTAMREHREPRSRSHDYRLPAVAWKRVLNELLEVAYGPLGGKRTGSSATLYRAIARIAKTVGETEAHPAYQAGMGVLGTSGDVLPGWVRKNGDRSPYPPGPEAEDEWRFVVFTPRLHSKHGLEITYWAISEPQPGDMLNQEAFHLSFARS